MQQEYKSGFVTLIGRSNVGKSTLVNAMVGEKVAIVSDRPQTTRNQIRGVLHRPDYQIVFIDTPGLHRLRRRGAGGCGRGAGGHGCFGTGARRRPGRDGPARYPQAHAGYPGSQ